MSSVCRLVSISALACACFASCHASEASRSNCSAFIMDVKSVLIQRGASTHKGAAIGNEVSIQHSDSCGMETITGKITGGILNATEDSVVVRNALSQSCHSTWEKGSPILVLAKTSAKQVRSIAVFEVQWISGEYFVLDGADRLVRILSDRGALQPLPEPIEFEYPTEERDELDRLRSLGILEYSERSTDLRVPAQYYSVKFSLGIHVKQLSARLRRSSSWCSDKH